MLKIVSFELAWFALEVKWINTFNVNEHRKDRKEKNFEKGGFQDNTKCKNIYIMRELQPGIIAR